MIERLRAFIESRRWFRIGRCTLCRRWSLYILRGDDALHEACWLDLK